MKKRKTIKDLSINEFIEFATESFIKSVKLENIEANKINRIMYVEESLKNKLDPYGIKPSELMISWAQAYVMGILNYEYHKEQFENGEFKAGSQL